MINFEFNTQNLTFKSNDKVFSPSNIDKGTLAMLSQVQFKSSDKLLDLGCGYGFVGIYASNFVNPKNIIMCDISKDAVDLSKENATLNGIKDLTIVQSDGYCVFMAEKRNTKPKSKDKPKNTLSKKLQRKQIKKIS